VVRSVGEVEVGDFAVEGSTDRMGLATKTHRGTLSLSAVGISFLQGGEDCQFRVNVIAPKSNVTDITSFSRSIPKLPSAHLLVSLLSWVST
jgi:hypothetical protein